MLLLLDIEGATGVEVKRTSVAKLVLLFGFASTFATAGENNQTPNATFGRHKNFRFPLPIWPAAEKGD